MMREDRDNFLALSSKRSCQEQTDHELELKRLQADLEAERIQTLWARGQLGADLRRLREEAEGDHKRAVRELAARRGGHEDGDGHGRLLAKEGKNKKSGQHGTVESTGERVLSCCGKTKLEQLLLTLYEEISGEQAARKLHHRQEFELEKANFLCRLLEAHGGLLQGTQGVGPPNCKTKNLSKNTIWDNGINPRQTTPLVTCSRSPLRSPSVSPLPTRKSKRDQEKQPSDGNLLTAAIGGTCQVSSLKTCHPQRTLRGGEDDQLSSWAESSGSDESSSSKCPARTMECPRSLEQSIGSQHHSSVISMETSSSRSNDWVPSQSLAFCDRMKEAVLPAPHHATHFSAPLKKQRPQTKPVQSALRDLNTA